MSERGEIQWGDVTVPLHPIFEALAYAAGFALYRLRRRRAGDLLDDRRRLTLVAVAIVGAALGSKLLHHLNSWSLLAAHWRDPRYLAGGRTIVGGLAGGLLATEFAKRRAGIIRRTGDLYVAPLLLGIGIGRIGCFLAGVRDDTAGSPTSSLFGMNLGDGVPRHPSPLYEIVFVAVLGGGLFLWRDRIAAIEGRSFRLFLGAYMSFRFLGDFLKPARDTIVGATPIQWVALAVALWSFTRLAPRGAEPPEPQHA